MFVIGIFVFLFHVQHNSPPTQSESMAPRVTGVGSHAHAALRSIDAGGRTVRMQGACAPRTDANAAPEHSHGRRNDIYISVCS